MSSPINPRIGKILAFRSGNRCAFPGCVQRLSIDGSNMGGASIIGEMAHIAGEKPGASRYDPTMTPAQRNGLENLIYLCPTHHTQIDKPGNKYTVEMIATWKRNHETRVDQATVEALPDVTFAELEIVTQAIADGVDYPFDGNFELSNPEEKMKRNGMTAKSRNMLVMGMAGSPQVRGFIKATSNLLPSFEDRLKSGF